MDTKPTIPSIKLFSEYLLAETEELSLATAAKTVSTTNSNPVVKALGAIDSAPPPPPGLPVERTSVQPSSGGQGVCRFWGTDQGCRRGDRCPYPHSWEGISKAGRCFKCSGTGHTKRDCVAGTKKDGAQDPPTKTPKVAKVTKVEKEVAPGPDAAVNPPGSGSKGETTGAEASKDPTNELIQEATNLLKTLRSMKAIRLSSMTEDAEAESQWALLDGGATHGLRQARPDEMDSLRPVNVDLAFGSTTLFRAPGISTLLAKEPVEPLIPLRALVERGFNIRWNSKGCVIKGMDGKSLACELRHGCPVMSRGDGLQLLDQIERSERGEGLTVDLEWWSSRFPEVPEAVWGFMKEIDPSQADRLCPWSRGVRRRVEKSKGVVVHLFAGVGAKTWQRLDLGEGVEVLTVELLQGQNLHEAATWTYLMKLAQKGLIRAVLGGPPCRTVSRLRHTAPGPRPLRGRGDCRFGLDGLSASEQQKTHGDTALVLKQLGLWQMAKDSKPRHFPDPAFFMESPTDLQDYLPMSEAASMPSFWSFPEVQQFLEEPDMFLAKFDQGAMGHQRRKPTTVMSNLDGIDQLHGISGGSYETLQPELDQRLRQTPQWSSWSPGLVKALSVALHQYVTKLPGFAEEKDGHVSMKGMTVEQWRQHIQRGHIPYHKNCRTCLREMGADRPHRRQKGGGSAYTLSADVVGPFIEGRDVGWGARKVRYALVATIPVPVIQNADVGVAEAAGEPEGVEEVAGVAEAAGAADGVDGDAGPGERDEVDPWMEGHEEVELVEDERVRALNAKARELLEDAKEPVQLQNVTFVEPLESRSQHHLLAALQTIRAKVRALGIPIFRFHSDRAREFLSQPIKRWCLENQQVQTMSAGDDPQANGRVESEINQVKRRLRLVLSSRSVPHHLWPCALRHVVEE